MSNPVELLRRALDALIAQDETICAEFCCTEIWDSPPIIEEIRAYLAAEPEAEPVAWTNQDELNALGTDATCYMYSEPMAGENNIPLYTISKPTSKPLTSNERLQGFIECRDNDDGAHLLSFLDGIRFAEKHHKIGVEE